MAQGKGASPHRIRLTIPADDQVTLAWTEAQSSVSWAMRVLIREAMAAHGPIDVLSRPLPQQASSSRPRSARPGERVAQPAPPDVAPAVGPATDAPVYKVLVAGSVAPEVGPAAVALATDVPAHTVLAGGSATGDVLAAETPDEPVEPVHVTRAPADDSAAPASGLGGVDSFFSQHRDDDD